MIKNGKCILCDKPCCVKPFYGNNIALEYVCDLCGSYGILRMEVAKISNDEKFKIIFLLRERAVKNDNFLVLSAIPDNVSSNEQSQFDVIYWEGFLESYPKNSELIDRTLLNLSGLHKSKSKRASEGIEIRDNDCPLLFSKDIADTGYIVGELQRKEFIRTEKSEDAITIYIQHEGWCRIEKMEEDEEQAKKRSIKLGTGVREIDL